ncbi:hypothetical protein [Helicobacter zhangjianzhongii]|uniref:Uncharacterized protein n=1 Tax=Helicobacter zhangjianzhongii TaxID=2974574 RepID=A0ACC6FTU8_9HELI|nr:MULTISPECIES: hypothetical protein [unclassified Helicobacter]MDL0080474.1 hypothetical protein [Helicobacter sp. CPD2-1]MDL0082375.1 hypothetical protein [Helicobacter sp. XJK30-2]
MDYNALSCAKARNDKSKLKNSTGLQKRILGIHKVFMKQAHTNKLKI